MTAQNAFFMKSAVRVGKLPFFSGIIGQIFGKCDLCSESLTYFVTLCVSYK